MAQVLVDAGLGEEVVAGVGNAVGRPVVRVDPTRSDALTGATFPVVWLGPGLPRELRDDRLLWFHSTSAGTDAVLREGPWPPGALLTRTVGRMGERIAQYVLAWVLAECQRLPDHLDQHRARVWRRQPSELAGGQAAVVLGVGAIGSTIAALLRSVGLRTLGVASQRRELPGFARVVGVDQAAEVLADARWVVAALPSTPATDGLVDARMLAAVRGATLLNVGRGATVDLDALESALRDGRLRGAVLDVLPDEPPGPGARCWSLPRTVVTSHSAGITADEDVVHDFSVCWEELRAGRMPWLRVRVERGY